MADTGGTRGKVFISYQRADVALAERLQAALEAAGVAVWRDKADLRPGDHVDFAIPEALREARAVATIWTGNSLKSEWVRHETAFAVVTAKSLMLAEPGFDYGKLPSPYRALNCGDIEALIADPKPLLGKLAEIDAANTPPAPKLLDTRQLPRTPNAFVARDGELALLRTAWAEMRPHILAFIAAGGTGKTALANAFLDEMAAEGYRGAEAVFAFSFDSQGTDDKRQGSSDRFFSEALTFFGEDPQAYDSVRKRAHRLADILETRRTLLILDGIEPMQAARGDDENGRLRDDAMRDFLVDLARDNKGLLVVTTRLPIPDLNGFRADQVAQHRLPNLPLSDAVTLMRGFGLRFPQEQMEALAREHGQTIARDPEHDGEATVRCHAKAIALIGSFIARRFKGAQLAPTLAEIADAFRMPDDAFLGTVDEALKQEPGYAVYRMVRRYEILYEDAAREMKKSLVGCAPGRQLILLRVMGLFDRPATWGAFQAVLAAPAIPGLTDDLDRITPGEWQEAVAALREDGLLNPAPGDSHVLGADSMLDAHPLIREYFGRQLAVVAKEAYEQAHARLYDYYRFQGLPAAFQEPVAYGILALGAAYPDAPFKNDVLKLADRKLPERVLEDWPPSLGKATPDDLRRAAALIDGPEFDAALKAFLPDDEAGMLPLFAAIAHGAAAGRHDEAEARSTGRASPAATRGLLSKSSACSARTWRRSHTFSPRRSRRRRRACRKAIKRWCSIWRAFDCARSGGWPRRWSRSGQVPKAVLTRVIGGELQATPPTSPSCSSRSAG